MFNFQSMNAFKKNVLHEVMQSSQLLSSFAALGKEVQLITVSPYEETEHLSRLTLPNGILAISW